LQSEEEINCHGRRKYYSAFMDTDNGFCISTSKRVATFPWSGNKIVNYELEIILVFYLCFVMCAAVWLGELNRIILNVHISGG
jgi:hypothetical protein